jgi:large subunit ribosomal protein L3
MKFILGKKIGMTQVFGDDGNVIPVTVVETSPITVIQERTQERDGYQALQFGFGARKKKNIGKPELGAWKDLGNFEAVREARGMSGVRRGEKLDLTQFQAGDTVKVSGISKAKGFQGVMKRHGFHGKFATHGTKHAHREPGSIGGGGGRAGGRVVKGMKMAGRMGADRVSVKNLEVVKVDAEHQIIALKGAVPGRRGTLIEIRG